MKLLSNNPQDLRIHKPIPSESEGMPEMTTREKAAFWTTIAAIGAICVASMGKIGEVFREKIGLSKTSHSWLDMGAGSKEKQEEAKSDATPVTVDPRGF